MRTVKSVFVNGRRVLLTPHAVKRWRERYCPDLSFLDALEHLATEVADHGSVRQRKPGWVKQGEERHRILTEGYLTLDRDRSGNPRVVFPLVPWPTGLIATTCLVRRS